MTEQISAVASQRCSELRTRLRRYKLVFVQLGAAFECLRNPIIDGLEGTSLSASDFVSSPSGSRFDSPLILTYVEEFARDGTVGSATLGQLRKRVDDELDRDVEVCLVSTAPRSAFSSVPGSSLIEDSATFILPLLESDEVGSVDRATGEWQIPALTLGNAKHLSKVFRDAVNELGVGVLASLDHAIFETEDRSQFLIYLNGAEAEAMRGAGLAIILENKLLFPFPRAINEFADEVANALADVVRAQHELGATSDDLWYIERTIRRSLRNAAIVQFEGRWRRRVLHGDLPKKVIDRARVDGNVTVDSVANLRDPIEWLSLGELLEVVQSNQFNGLEFDQLSWRRFADDILPVRNRLSHMRILKKGDRETVRMWVSRIHKKFG